jgi:hypothetical protein
MRPIAESIVTALESIGGIDTSDISSLAYASGLFAIEMALPSLLADDIEFEVSVIDDNFLSVDSDDLPPSGDIRAAIDVIATHYFQSVRLNLPLHVH